MANGVCTKTRRRTCTDPEPAYGGSYLNSCSSNTTVAILASDCFELVYYTSVGTSSKVEYTNDMNPKKCQDLCIEEETSLLITTIEKMSII